MKQYRLSDGTFGSSGGIWHLSGGGDGCALPLAVETGYRYFDTAAYYFN